jgi:hypothetical protein
VTLQGILDRLRERPPAPLFVGDPWDADLDRLLRAAPPEALFSGLVLRDARMAACALAGLHLWNDSWEACHNLCQGIATPTGRYWHGLAHRREGHRGEGLAANLGNAKYWFHRTGEHPAYPAARESALRVLDAAGSAWAADAADWLRTGDAWDPFLIVDWVADAEARRLPEGARDLLEEIQTREMALLTDWCLLQAAG